MRFHDFAKQVENYDKNKDSFIQKNNIFNFYENPQIYSTFFKKIISSKYIIIKRKHIISIFYIKDQ